MAVEAEWAGGVIKGEDDGDLVDGEAVLAQVSAAAAAVEERLVAGAGHAARCPFYSDRGVVSPQRGAGTRNGRWAGPRGSSFCVG